ncbi:MAG: hypothetical protein IK041_03565 [Bacteroidales bacterium]|nr:hypothetical protein [Bacteroidales bacterium]
MKAKVYPNLEFDNVASNSVKRKLIDIPEDVFRKLSILAKKEGVSLKKYIENLLVKNVRTANGVLSEGDYDDDILYLAGIAVDRHPEENKNDDRLQYLLNK